MIITRFAPSPTGYLHVGGIRTAIFNWAFARKHNGKFLLRIDDTDQDRHIEDAVEKIEEDFDWLDIAANTIIRQSSLRSMHDASIESLLKSGKAYLDDGCVRLDVKKVAEGDLIINDLILGPVSRNIKDIKDFVIRRSDGSPLYNLATVVDDASLEVTHVIRGQEHLTNSFPQLLLYKAFEWEIPQFAHIPFICAPNSNRKMSKRDDVPCTLDVYRKQGYLSQTIFNYLCHLGWALDAEREKWSRQEFLNNFELEDICKSPAAFDPKKLLWLQGEYMKDRSVLDRLGMVKAQRPDLDSATLLQVVRAAGDRLRLSSDINSYLHFFNDDDFVLDPKAVKKRLKDDALSHLKAFRNSMGDFEPNQIETQLGMYCEKNELKPATLIHALRVATTGNMIGFGVFEGIEILGMKRTLERIDRLG